MKKIILKKKDKKAQWRGYILPLILGLIVLSLVLYFIFKEYFTEEDLGWQQCRQSVLVRSVTPELRAGGIGIADLKNKFPLKCQTNVVEIDFEDKEKAEKLVTDTLAQCWYMFLEGKQALFPGGADLYPYCVPCARIHFEEKVKDFYSYKKNPLDISVALNRPLQNTGVTYKEYFGKAFQLYITYWTDLLDIINFGGADTVNFDFSKDYFKIDSASWTLGTKLGKVYLPKKISSENGDILIIFQQIVFRTDEIDSNMIYFQVGQKELDPFTEVSQTTYIQYKKDSEVFCPNWDGIPA